MPSSTQHLPPVAARRPVLLSIHGEVRVDDYYWLREREDPEVLAYLRAENDYTEAMTAHLAAFRERLFTEMLGRIKEDDATVPYLEDGWWNYARTEEGRSYDLYCRREGSLEAPEQVVLDVNRLAEGHEYTAVGNLEMSPDGALMAYAVDHDGSELFELRVVDLLGRATFGEAIAGTYYGLAWANDNQTLFYVLTDHAHRPYQVWRHTLGTPPDRDVLVYEETDERFSLEVGRSKSGRFVQVVLTSSVTSEVRFYSADDPAAPVQAVFEREQDVETYPRHCGDVFFIRTNKDAVNFKLVSAPLDAPSSWTTVVPHRDDVTIEDVLVFADHVVLYERCRGLLQFRVLRLSDGDEHVVDFPDCAHAASPGVNVEFHSHVLRFTYETLATPLSTFDYDMNSRQRILLKKREVLGGFDEGSYLTERIEATSADGTTVPASLVRRRDLPLPAPTLLFGYGSYGVPYDVYFDSVLFSLLDRGMVVAFAHVRGGGDLGRGWKEQGKYLHKWNTFTDFIAVAEHMKAEGITARLAIQGGSAGGLLMGVVSNCRPELFDVVVADVPFVDVVTTMLDESIPLTVVEWEEWGSPRDETYYRYMLSYSPYDNVAAVAYPDMLVLAGLNDPRVQYWEPAKWVARMRSVGTGDGALLLRTNLGAGHGGASGRYGYLEDMAFQFSFVLDRLGLVEDRA